MDIEENWQTPSFATMRSSVRSRLAPPIFQSLRATPNPESVPFCSNNKYQACRGKLPHRFSGLHRHHPAHTHFYRHSLNVSALRRRSCIGVHWAPGPGPPSANGRDKQKPRYVFRTVSARMLAHRRRYTRVPIRAQVTCIVDSRTMRGVSWNLSQGGMQVQVSDLKPKEGVKLSFRLPVSGVAVDAVGAVAWGDEKRHGIQFTYLGAQSRQSILQYIAEHMER
jgi:hypothetical protein